MSSSPSNASRESGYILIAFLVLVAILAATVSMFALTALNNQKSVSASIDRETSYQMARAGLSAWMGKVREDYETYHITPDFGGTDTETLAHPWGWGHPITKWADDGDTLMLGEKVFLPSGEKTAQEGDAGFFRITHVEGASGELLQTFAELSCKASPEDPPVDTGPINVNTASDSFLQQIVYDHDPTKKLTADMAQEIIEHRSGSTDSTSDPDGDGEIELNEEDYSGTPNPFEPNYNDICELLDGMGDFDKVEHCQDPPSYFRDNTTMTSNGGKFCVDVRGAAIDVTSPPSYEVRSTYNLRAKVQRPGALMDTGPIRILTIR